MWVDLPASIPVELLTLLVASEDPHSATSLLRVLRAARFLRLLRVVRLLKIARQFDASIIITRAIKISLAALLVLPWTPPDLEPRLDHVHGQRIEDVRSALRYNAHGAIVYAAGALGVVYTPSEHEQQFHRRSRAQPGRR